MTIHHTASLNSGTDEKARMRGFQAFHIDNRKWCDIGYHFVVGPSGTIYQGRSDEERTGAHVGGENTNNVGICLMGNFEEETVGDAQFDGAVDIVGWVGREYEIPFTRDRIRGHQEWPGQSTACPGADLLGKLDTLVAEAGEGGPVVVPQGDVRLSMRWLDDAPPDRHTQGSSAGQPDPFEGDTLRAEILVENDTDEALGGVVLGYGMATPHLRATSYTIYTDAPSFDGATWMVNDANEAPENPPEDGLGASGELVMYAFAAGETKRVVVDLEVGAPPRGDAAHPDLRAWVAAIEDLHRRDTFDGPAEPAAFGELRGRARVDILRRDAWFFDGGEPSDFEGWDVCRPGHHADLRVEDGALTLEVTGADACLDAPAWTSVDADRYDQMVIRVRSEDGPHPVVVRWMRAGEQGDLAETHSVRFEAPGDGALAELVVPLGDLSAWSGEVTRLRVEPLAGRAPESGDEGLYAIDAITFQSSDGEATTDPDSVVIEVPVVEIEDDEEIGPPVGDDPVLASGEDIVVNNGACAAAPGGRSPGAPLGALLAAALGAALARRRARRDPQ
jgi:hypothetical protein